MSKGQCEYGHYTPVFDNFLVIFIIVYLDDILIYSKTQEEDDIHVRRALQWLREYSLYANLDKCSFDQRQVKFIGYIVSSHGISMDTAKAETVLDWQTP